MILCVRQPSFLELNTKIEAATQGKAKEGDKAKLLPFEALPSIVSEPPARPHPESLTLVPSGSLRWS